MYLERPQRILWQVKVLKLCSSDETTGDMPDDLRAYRIAQRLLQERLGEEVEVVVQPVWPTPRLPKLIERWIEQHQPDIVLLHVNPYWTTFESVPLALQRHYGPLGRVLGDAMKRAGEHPELRAAWWVRMGRWASVRLVRGAYEFEPEEVAAVLEESLPKLLARETLEVAIRGATGSLGYHGTKRTIARAEDRQDQTDDAVEAVCKRHHVRFLRRSEMGTLRHYVDMQRDRVHSSVASHREQGEVEAKLVEEVWIKSRGPAAR